MNFSFLYSAMVAPILGNYRTPRNFVVFLCSTATKRREKAKHPALLGFSLIGCKSHVSSCVFVPVWLNSRAAELTMVALCAKLDRTARVSQVAWQQIRYAL